MRTFCRHAIDWASRPWGTNSLAHKPSAVIGASPGEIGTAVAQQNLRSVLSFCDSPQMDAPEAYIQFTPGMITDDGEVTEPSTEAFLRDFMAAFEVFMSRVLTVLPRKADRHESRCLSVPFDADAGPIDVPDHDEFANWGVGAHLFAT